MTRSARGRRDDSGDVANLAPAPKRTENAPSAEPNSAGGGGLSRLWHSFMYDRSVRTRLSLLVFIPLLGALVFGGYVFKEAIDRAAAASTVERNAQIAVDAINLVSALQDERDESGLAEAGVTGSGGVASKRDITDERLAVLNQRIEGLADDGGDTPLAEATRSTRVQLDLLNAYREARDIELEPFDERGADKYEQVIQALLKFIKATGTGATDSGLLNEIDALDTIARATESASVERGLLGYVIATSDEMTDEQRQRHAGFRREQDFLLERFATIASPEIRAQYFNEMPAVRDGELDAETGERTGGVETMRNEALTVGENPSFTPEEWYGASSRRIQVMQGLQASVADSIVDRAASTAGSAQWTAAITAALVLLVLGATMGLAYAVARSITQPLRRLRTAALETADEGLPALVSRIHQDGPAVVRQAGDAVKPEGSDEIGQLASAFNAVHSTAVRVASEQALLRQNLDTIVVNLSRRTHSLIDRQLGEIEELEARERDPDQLGTLFRIDHLATRVRRHAESLLVLAGVEEMQRQGAAAPVLDVVRAAVGEVEQYPRIKFGVMPTDLVVPSAVDDVAHLLAELLDNATEFSAPSTAVTITSQPLLGGGLRLQVTDTGLGMPPDQLSMLNERLRQPGEIDVAASRTLGLYVVARLAAKHGITVRLVPAEGTSGTIAQVDLPAHLVVSPLDTADGVLQAVQPSESEPRQRTESLLDERESQNAREHSARPPGLPQRTPAAPAPPSSPTRQPAPPPQPVGFAAANGVPGQAPPAAAPPQPSPQPTSQPQPAPQQPAPRQPAPQPVGLAGAQPPTARSLRASEPPLPKGDSPIYDQVRSAWFSKGRSLDDWSSPADEGWRRAAAALRTAEDAANARRTSRGQGGEPAQRPAPQRQPGAGTLPQRPQAPQRPGTFSQQPAPQGPARQGPAPQAPARPGPAPQAPGQSPTPWTRGGSPGPAAEPPAQPAPPTRPAPTPAPSPTPAAGASPAGPARPGGSPGLPVRQRGATLVPGSIPAASSDPAAKQRPKSKPKDARNVASSLSNLQRGVSRGREEAGGWVPKRPSDSERSNQ